MHSFRSAAKVTSNLRRRGEGLNYHLRLSFHSNDLLNRSIARMRFNVEQHGLGIPEPRIFRRARLPLPIATDAAFSGATTSFHVVVLRESRCPDTGRS